MNSDPTRRFSGVVADYARYRPGYPREAVDWIIEAAPLPAGGRVIDLACGTGISARAFAERGFEVIGVDANAAMLARARRTKSRVDYVMAQAERTGLLEGCAALVTAAQAFHWFNAKAVQKELRRILQPRARCAAFWNVRAATPFLDAYEKLLLRFSSEYASLPGPCDAIAAIEALPGVSRLQRRRFPHVARLDLKGVLGRARSSSYVALGVSDKASFEAELSALFERSAVQGLVDWKYETEVVLFRP